METVTLTISKALWDNIVKNAADTVVGDDPDFNAMDYSGGNFDDAYAMGMDDGEVELAQWIVSEAKNIVHNND